MSENLGMPDEIGEPSISHADRTSVTVVIVNYKVADCVIECIRSLEAEIREHSRARVIVVDNDSKDGSVERIADFIETQQCQAWAEVVPSDFNGGYAYGNNFAIRLATSRGQDTEFYWLLNPDSVVRPGALGQLIDFMKEHPQVGICGSSIEQEDGSLWPICFRFPTILSEVERGMQFGPVTRLLGKWKVPREMGPEATQVDWLPGASTLIRSRTLRDVGLLDEGYFLYYEETDFALDALRRGWQCWYVPPSRIMHVGGMSTGVTSSEAVDSEKHKRIPQYIFDSRYRYFSKNHGWLYAAMADIAWLATYSLRRLRYFIQRRPRGDAPHLWRDSMKNAAWLRWLVR